MSLTTTLIIVFILSAVIFCLGYLLSRWHFRNKIKRINENHESELLKARIEIQEQVGDDISREIHDNISQVMSLARVLIKRLQAKARVEDKNDFTEILSILERAISEIRNISKSLSAFYHENFDFFKVLEMDLDRLVNSQVLKIRYSVNDVDNSIPPGKGLILYRIYQECINNVLKHARANQVDINIRQDGHSFRMELKDDGRGFDLNALVKPNFNGAGQGLVNLKSRVKSIGGIINIISSPGKGTTIIVDVDV